MGHHHTRIQGPQPTREKPQDKDLEDKSKRNVVFCTTVDPDTTNKDKIYSDICGRFPKTRSRGNKYISVMYGYECNAILTAATKNRSNTETIQSFI